MKQNQNSEDTMTTPALKEKVPKPDKAVNNVLIANASDKIKDWMIRNMFNKCGARESSTFFISLKREVGHYPFRAGVGFVNGGIVLFLDAKFVMACSDSEIDFVLLHELGHIARLSFLRTEELCEFLNLPAGTIAPYADPPINYSLRHHSAYSTLDSTGEGMFTYDTMRKNGNKEVKDGMTYEELVMLQKNEGKLPKVYYIDSEGNITNEDGQTIDGDTERESGIVMAKPDKRDVPGIKESVKTHTEQVQKAIGNDNSYFLQEIKEAYSREVESGYRLLEKFLTGIRASKEPAERSFRKLQRKALPMGLLLPAIITNDNAFNCLYITDESGSMSEHEVEYSAGLLQKVLLRKNLDTIYIAHWDTDLCGEIDKLKANDKQYKYTRNGYGGTDFTNCFSHDKIKPILTNVDMVVFITDAEVSGLPKDDIGKPTLWLTTTNCGYGIDAMKARGDHIIDISFIRNK